MNPPERPSFPERPRLPENWEMYNLALHQMKAGNLTGALDKIDQTLRDHPNYAPAHALRSLCRLRQARLVEASQCALRAVALDPNDQHALNALAAVRKHEGKYFECAEIYERLLALAPQVSAYYMNCADLYRLKNNSPEELSLLTKAIELDPQNPVVHARLATYHWRQKSNEAAERFARQAIAIDPDCAEALVVAARVALVQCRFEQARADALWALRSNVGAAEAHWLAILTGLTRYRIVRMAFYLTLWNQIGIARMGFKRLLIFLGSLFVFAALVLGSLILATQLFGDVGAGILPAFLAVVIVGAVAAPFMGRLIMAKRLKRVKIKEDF